MILTHLVFFKFLPGAGAPTTPTTTARLPSMFMARNVRRRRMRRRGRGR